MKQLFHRPKSKRSHAPSRKPLVVLLAGVTAGLLGATANARCAEPENAISVGVYAYQFHSRSSDLKGPFTPPGIRATAADTSTAAFVYTRMLSRKWSATLALGVPPTYVLHGAGAAQPLGAIGAAKAISPALVMQRHWATPSPLTPFVGLGVSYNHFSDLTASPSLVAALGGPTEVRVRDVWAPAFTVGADYALSRRSFVTVAATYIDTTANAKLITGGLERTIRIELNPVVYRLTYGFRY